MRKPILQGEVTVDYTAPLSTENFKDVTPCFGDEWDCKSPECAKCVLEPACNKATLQKLLEVEQDILSQIKPQ